MSIILIVVILLYNTNKLYYMCAFVLPLSIDRISFLYEFDNFYVLDNSEMKERKLYQWNQEEIKQFLNSLDNENYLVRVEFVPSEEIIDAPWFMLSSPILINKHSSSTTIAKFINERVDIMVDFFHLENFLIPSSHGKIRAIV